MGCGKELAFTILLSPECRVFISGAVMEGKALFLLFSVGRDGGSDICLAHRASCRFLEVYKDMIDSFSFTFRSLRLKEASFLHLTGGCLA